MRNPGRTGCQLRTQMTHDDESSDKDEVLPTVDAELPLRSDPPLSSEGDRRYKPSFLHTTAHKMATLACQDQFPASALSSVASEWDDSATLDSGEIQTACEVLLRDVAEKKAVSKLPDIALMSVGDGSRLETIPETEMDPSAESPCSTHATPDHKESELIYAVQTKNVSLAMSILKRPSFSEVNKQNKQGQTALHIAAAAGLDDVCMSILARPDFTQVNATSIDGSTALHIAAQARLSVACMVMLSRPDFNKLNAVDSAGKTALHIAAGAGLEDVCLAILLTSDFCQVNSIDKAGRTVLHAAACAGLREVCLAILNRRDFNKVSAVDNDDNTTLHVAVKGGLSDIALSIVARKGFNHVNATDANDKTALHLAAAGGLTEVCSALLKSQDFASITARDRRGRTAAEYASKHGHKELAQMLRDGDLSHRSGGA